MLRFSNPAGCCLQRLLSFLTGLLVVTDSRHLVDRVRLQEEIAAMTRYITASPPRHPDEPVLIPGDPERLMRAERIKNGVPIDDETWRELTVAARGINVLVEAPE